MGDLLLLASLAGVCFAGWLMVKKLDRFLEENEEKRQTHRRPEEDVLRIGFLNPPDADGLEDIPGDFAQKYPRIPVRLFCGTKEELEQKLVSGRLDIIFLREYGGEDFSEGFWRVSVADQPETCYDLKLRQTDQKEIRN